MPNWKKVITSGSNAHLNHITSSGNISSSGTIIGSNLSGTNTGDQDLSSLAVIDGGAISENNFVLGSDGATAITDSPVSLKNSEKDFAMQTLNISSSGNIKHINHITASGNISASSTSTGSFGRIETSGGISASGNCNFNNGTAIGNFNVISNLNTFGNIIGDNNTNIQGINDITTLGDSNFGNSTADTHTFNGGIIAGNITASGNISASGFSHNFGGNIILDDGIEETSRFIQFAKSTSNSKITFDNSTKLMFFNSDNGFKFNGNITASGPIGGNISSSGTITTNNITINGTQFTNRIDRVDGTKNGVEFADGIFVSQGHITASGNISASGGGHIFGGSGTAQLDVQGHITASGNVKVTGDLLLTGSGNLYGSSSYLNILNDGTAPSEIRLHCEDNGQHYIGIRGPVHAGASSYVLKLPNDAPSDNQILKVNGSPSGTPTEVTLAWESDGGGGGGGVSFPTTEVISSSTDLFIGKTDAPFISGSSGNLQLSGSGTVGQLEVDHRFFDTGSSTVGSAGGAIGDTIKFGDSSGLTPGKVYYLESDGTWDDVDANFGGKTSGSIAVATNAAATNGMVLRGVVKLSHDPGGAIGAPLYISAANTGQLVSAVPGSGDFVRIVGYNLDESGLIFFNPGDTTIKVA